MKHEILFSVILSIGVFFYGVVPANSKDDMKKINRENNAINAVIEQFSKDKHICNDKQDKVKFAVQSYLPGKDHIQWPQDIEKAISACREKYMINMEQNDAQSVYVYCYDNQIPKLVANSTAKPKSEKTGCGGK
jgi:hypothetical protein